MWGGTSTPLPPTMKEGTGTEAGAGRGGVRDGPAAHWGRQLLPLRTPQEDRGEYVPSDLHRVGRAGCSCRLEPGLYQALLSWARHGQQWRWEVGSRRSAAIPNFTITPPPPPKLPMYCLGPHNYFLVGLPPQSQSNMIS